MKVLVILGFIFGSIAHADLDRAVIYVSLNSKTLSFKSPHIELKNIPVAVGRRGYPQAVGRYHVYNILTGHHTRKIYEDSLPTTELFYLGGFSIGNSAYHIDEANIQKHTTQGKIVVAKAIMDELLDAVRDAQASGQQIFVDVRRN